MPFLKNGGQRGDLSCSVGLALRARQLRFGQIAVTFVPLPFTGADKLTATTAWRQNSQDCFCCAKPPDIVSVVRYSCGEFKLKKGLYALLEKWWPERGSNPRHEDFQSSALPTELSGRPRICLINNFFLFGKHFFYFFRGFADNCFILLFLYAFLFYWSGRKGAGRQVIRRGWEFF